MQSLAWCLGAEFVVLWEHLGDEKFFQICNILAGRNIVFPKREFLEEFCWKIKLVELYNENKISLEDVLQNMEKFYFDIISEVLKNKKHACIPAPDGKRCVICSASLKKVKHTHKFKDGKCEVCGKVVLNE